MVMASITTPMQMMSTADVDLMVTCVVWLLCEFQRENVFQKTKVSYLPLPLHKRVLCIVVPAIFIKGMLQGVKLGMLWGTIKSTFCHRSSPNRSNSKNKVYPRIKHDAESLKYSYVYDWCVVTGSNCR